MVEPSKASRCVDTRPTWDEYFLMLAKLASTRSTCLSCPVGAVIVKDRQILATGYNGPPSGTDHCTKQGFCYPELANCSLSKELPSRAIHAEANAIAQAAKHGVSTDGASIYVTLEPCLSCLKLIISAGIKEIFYETSLGKSPEQTVRKMFIRDNLVSLSELKVSEVVITAAINHLENSTSVIRSSMTTQKDEVIVQGVD